MIEVQPERFGIELVGEAVSRLDTSPGPRPGTPSMSPGWNAVEVHAVRVIAAVESVIRIRSPSVQRIVGPGIHPL